jgi:hypothetical protein
MTAGLQLVFPLVELAQDASPSAMRESQDIITINVFDEVITPTAAAKAARAATRAGGVQGEFEEQCHYWLAFVSQGHEHQASLGLTSSAEPCPNSSTHLYLLYPGHVDNGNKCLCGCL